MQLPLRQFQLHASEYLKDLPVELTRYGKIVAIVIAPTKVVLTDNFDIAPKHVEKKDKVIVFSDKFFEATKIIKTPEDALKAVHAKVLTELPFSKSKQSSEKLHF